MINHSLWDTLDTNIPQKCVKNLWVQGVYCQKSGIVSVPSDRTVATNFSHFCGISGTQWGLSGTQRESVGVSGTQWGLSGSQWGPVGLSGSQWDSVGVSGTQWDSLGVLVTPD